MAPHEQMPLLARLKRVFTLRKLLFIFLFYGMEAGVFAFGWWKQAADPRLAGLNMLQYSVWISRGAGLVLTVLTTLIVVPMARTLLRFVRPKLRWLPLDENQWFHRQVAYNILFFTTVHTASHYVNFFNVEKMKLRGPNIKAVDIHYTQAGGITGHIMILCMLGIFTTSHHRIRQQSFETFWYTHHLFIPFLLGMYTHATGCFVRDSKIPYSPFAGYNFWRHCIGYEGWRWELFGGGIYLIERVYREIRSRRHTEITKVVRHPYDVVEIQFSKKSMKYKPGQWLFINCPSVSKHQWHPFTITSCPFDPYISIHVRQVGDWTRQFADAVGAGNSQAKFYDDLDPLGMYEVALAAGEKMPRIRIDGPYGAPAEDVFKNKIAVLVGTGIGVTPWASVLKNIWHMRQSPDPPKRLRRVEFIWICKDTNSFQWFQALLSSLEQQAGMDDDFLRIHTYLTQRVDADTAQNIVLNSVGAERDPLTELRSRTNFGRPDFARLFVTLRDSILDGTYKIEGGKDVGRDAGGEGLGANLRAKVGVYFCGPYSAAREIRSACKMANSNEVRFKFWKEHF